MASRSGRIIKRKKFDHEIVPVIDPGSKKARQLLEQEAAAKEANAAKESTVTKGSPKTGRPASTQQGASSNNKSRTNPSSAQGENKRHKKEVLTRTPSDGVAVKDEKRCIKPAGKPSPKLNSRLNPSFAPPKSPKVAPPKSPKLAPPKSPKMPAKPLKSAPNKQPVKQESPATTSALSVKVPSPTTQTPISTIHPPSPSVKGHTHRSSPTESPYRKFYLSPRSRTRQLSDGVVGDGTDGVGGEELSVPVLSIPSSVPTDVGSPRTTGKQKAGGGNEDVAVKNEHVKTPRKGTKPSHSSKLASVVLLANECATAEMGVASSGSLSSQYLNWLEQEDPGGELDVVYVPDRPPPLNIGATNKNNSWMGGASVRDVEPTDLPSASSILRARLSHLSKEKSHLPSPSNKLKSLGKQQIQSKDFTPEDDVKILRTVLSTGDMSNLVGENKGMSAEFSLGDIELRWQMLLYDETFARRLVAYLQSPERSEHRSISQDTSNPQESLNGSEQRPIVSMSLSPQEVAYGAAGALSFHQMEEDLLRELENDESRSLFWEGDYDKHSSLQKILQLEDEVFGNKQCSLQGHNCLARMVTNNMQFIMKSRVAVIGRNCPGHVVDIDLSSARNAGKISRKQVVVKLRKDGKLYAKNVGKRPIFINSRTLEGGSKRKLPHSCLLTIGGISILFEANVAVLKNIQRQMNSNVVLVPTASGNNNNNHNHNNTNGSHTKTGTDQHGQRDHPNPRTTSVVDGSAAF